MSTRRYTLARRKAIAAGCRRSERSVRTREIYRLVLQVISRLGYGGLLTGPVRYAALHRVVAAAAPAANPETAEGYALAAAAESPEACERWLRRNPKLVQGMIKGRIATKARPGGVEPSLSSSQQYQHYSEDTERDHDNESAHRGANLAQSVR